MNIFSENNAYNRGMTKVFDLCVISVLTTVFCIPLFTSGAALTAMYAVMMKMTKNREGSIVSSYIKEFKSNLSGSVAGSVILVAGVLLISFDLTAWTQNEVEGRSIWYGVTLVILLYFLVVLDWYLSVRARFVETTPQALANAVRFSLIHLPFSIGMGVYTMLIIWLVMKFAFLLFLVPFVGFAVVCFPKAFIIGRKIDKCIKDEGLAPKPQATEDESEKETGEGISKNESGYDKLTELKKAKKNMKMLDRVSYVWYNHIGVFVFAGVFLLVVGGIGYSMLFNDKSAEFTLAAVNTYSDKGDNELTDALNISLGFDGKDRYSIVDTGYQLAYNYGGKRVDNTASDESNFDKFFLNIRNRVMDAAIVPRSFYDYCNSIEDVFYDIEYVVGQEELAKLKPFLEKGSGDYEEYYRGIRINDCSFLKKNGIRFIDANKDEDYILVFPTGSGRIDNSRRFLKEVIWD
ncbi:MAG: YesL family protein [Eubacterium sp.]|nr:YesL family protein [Eubacterium sp.]